MGKYKQNKKTFKIGEYCQGGIIEAVLYQSNTQKLTITIRDYYTNEELDSEVFEGDDLTDFNWKCEVEMWCEQFTTCYYAGKVYEWVEKILS